jgi:hypothetical protein
MATILKALSIGATYKDSAEAAGVDYASFNSWMKRGEADGAGKFYKFFQAVRRTEAETRVKFVSVITKAASDGEWKAALEYLKRRDRANWGDSAAVEHSGGVRVVIVDETEKEGEDDDAER